MKKEYLLLGAVALALSLYLVQRDTDKTHYQLPQLAAFSKADISKIELSMLDNSITIDKTDRWRIAPQGFPAYDSKINPMLEAAENLTLTALVSESKNYNRYDLDDDQKISVKLFTGETLTREFDVGKPAASNRHSFIKLGGDHRVYDARENLRRKFSHKASDLRDMTTLAFDKNTITEIELEQNGKVTKLVKKEVTKETAEASDTKNPSPATSEMAWVSDGGKNTDEAKVHSLLHKLSKLRTGKYLDDRKKEDFKNPIYTVRVKGGKQYTLTIFAKPDEETQAHPATSSANDYPFELSQDQVDDIMVDPDDIIGT